MDSIGLLKTGQVEQTKIFQPGLNDKYKTKPYALDSFEKTEKTQKKFSFKGLGTATKAIDSLKEFGIRCFKEGVAFGEDGQKFTGKITKKASNGDVFEINFFNGRMLDSTKNPASGFLGEMKKYYKHDIVTGKLQKVETKAKGETVAVTKFNNDKIITYAKDINKNPEAIRRRNLSDEEILKEAQGILDECFKKKGLNESLIPKVILEEDEYCLAGYCGKEHIIAINPKEYRNGLFSTHNILMHEATHAERASLRARLPEEIKEKTIREELIRKVLEGDNRYVEIVDEPIIIPQPKMSDKMKKEFVELAEKSVYTKGDMEKVDKINFKEMAEKLINNNPDFLDKYKSKEDAVGHIEDYLKSHYTRYNHYSYSTSRVNTSDLPELTPKEIEEAKKSCIEALNCGAVNKTKEILDEYKTKNQEYITDYLCDDEEILCNKEGYSYTIEKMKKKIEELKSKGARTPELEGYYYNFIKEGELSLEFRNKLIEINKMRKQMTKNPALKENVEYKNMFKEIKEEFMEVQEELMSLGNLPIASVVHRQAK